MADFEIGSSLIGMTNLESLTTALPVPRSWFYPFSEYVMTGNGKKRGIGLPRARWVFPVLTTEQRDQLREFCEDPSTDVFIRTATNEDDDAYATFSGVMHWVEEEERLAGFRFEVEILFTELVEQEEVS
jgi:hypothetical protein